MKTTTVYSKTIIAAIVILIGCTVSSCSVSKNSMSYKQNPSRTMTLDQLFQEGKENNKDSKIQEVYAVAKDTTWMSADGDTTFIKRDSVLNVEFVKPEVPKLIRLGLYADVTYATRTSELGIDGGVFLNRRLGKDSPFSLYASFGVNYQRNHVEGYYFDQYGINARLGLLIGNFDNLNARLNMYLATNHYQDMHLFEECGDYNKGYGIVPGVEGAIEWAPFEFKNGTRLGFSVSAGYYMSNFKRIELEETPYKKPKFSERTWEIHGGLRYYFKAR